MKFYIDDKNSEIYEIVKSENHPIRNDTVCLTCKNEYSDNFNVDVQSNCIIKLFYAPLSVKIFLKREENY